MYSFCDTVLFSSTCTRVRMSWNSLEDSLDRLDEETFKTLLGYRRFEPRDETLQGRKSCVVRQADGWRRKRDITGVYLANHCHPGRFSVFDNYPATFLNIETHPLRLSIQFYGPPMLRTWLSLSTKRHAFRLVIRIHAIRDKDPFRKTIPPGVTRFSTIQRADNCLQYASRTTAVLYYPMRLRLARTQSHGRGIAAAARRVR